MKSFIFRMLCGFFIGVSVVAPGVSGSVMAVMMGIYRELIEIISNPFKNFKKNVIYLIPMALGGLISLLVFVKLLAFLFDKYPIQARILFMGLVAGGLPTMFRHANTDGKFAPRNIIAILGAFVIAAGVGMMARNNGGVVTENFPMYYLCISGAIAGAASMAPGMSVSMVLMLLGVYDYLLQTASGYTENLIHTLSIAMPVAVCFAVGMVLFSKLTKFVFEKYSSVAYFMVFGFMCGTLTAIMPKTAPDTAGGWLGSVVALIFGIGVAQMFEFLGKKFNVD